MRSFSVNDSHSKGICQSLQISAVVIHTREKKKNRSIVSFCRYYLPIYVRKRTAYITAQTTQRKITRIKYCKDTPMYVYENDFFQNYFLAKSNYLEYLSKF